MRLLLSTDRLASNLADRNMLIGEDSVLINQWKRLKFGRICHLLCVLLVSRLATPRNTAKKLACYKPKRPKSLCFTHATYDKETVEGVETTVREVQMGMYTQTREVYDNGKQVCQTCLKLNNTPRKYPRCKRCWDTMQREVLYCSPCVASIFFVVYSRC